MLDVFNFHKNPINIHLCTNKNDFKQIIKNVVSKQNTIASKCDNYYMVLKYVYEGKLKKIYTFIEFYLLLVHT